MLVLSRKLNEQIRINDRVTLTILRIQGKSVRIGIEAPKDVHIVRGELPSRDERPDERGEESDGPLQSKVIMARIPARDQKTVSPQRVNGDRRQAPISSQHPDRWTFSAMKDRARGDSKTCRVESRFPAR